jgi:hypothetical protein
MIGARATSSSVDRTAELGKLLEEVSRLQVYVGIPEEKSSRPGDGEITNAELCYIHTHGSPLHGIPARPIIEPAIEAEDNKEAISVELSEALKSVLDGKPQTARAHLEKAGQEGEESARDWFEDPRNQWPPNSPETVRRKIERLRGKRKAAALAAYEGGQSTYEYRGSTHSVNLELVDTEELRKSITYVVKESE